MSPAELRENAVAMMRGRADDEVFTAFIMSVADTKRAHPELTNTEVTLITLELFVATREAARQDARAELTVLGVQ